MATPAPAPTPTTQRARGNPQRNNPLPQNTNKDVGSTRAAVQEVPDVKEEELSRWVDTLYQTMNISDEEVKEMWEAFSYKGFNRDDVLKQLRALFPDPRFAMRVVVLIALRGPQQGSTIKLRVVNL